MNRTALLVIDVQKSFEQRSYWNEQDLAQWQHNQSALIRIARERSWPVIFVYHNEKDGVFSADSGYVVPMDFVDRRKDDPVFNKWVHNALTDSGLHEWLQAEGIQSLVISGIRTEQCCETTTRVASDLGYHVDFVLDATLTFSMQHPITGNRVDAASIQSHTALVLADRFATIWRTQDLIRASAA